MARRPAGSPDLSHIHPELRRFARPIGKLLLDPQNARGHSAENIAAIRESLREHGQVRAAIVTREAIVLHEGHPAVPAGTILVGNGMVTAAREMGWAWVAAIEFEGGAVEARKLALRDNRTAELASWVVPNLVADLRSLQALDVRIPDLGWADAQLDALIAEAGGGGGEGGDGGGGKAGEDPGAQPDRAAELQAKWGTQAGQLWEIPSKAVVGKVHRLLCGDSTRAEDVERVMAGEKAVAVLTDPPYGMDLDTDWSDVKGSQGSIGGKRGTSGKKHERVIGDAKPYDPAPIFEMFGYCDEMFLWGADYYAERIPDRNDGSWLVWDKRKESQADAIGAEFELCWSRARHKRRMLRHDWFGFLSSENTGEARNRMHPTQKPSSLYRDMMEQWIKAGGIVFDGYHGSGTTMVAAEQTGRLCNAIEIAPRYVAVALERLSSMGLKPRLVK